MPCFLGLPHYLLQRLQYVQNAAARLIAQKRKYDHVTQQIRKVLHWLPMKHRIDFKVLVQAYKAQHNLSPAYLSELITPYRPRRFRSSCDENRLVEHRTNINHYHLKICFGDRAFQNAAPKLLNELPMFIRQCESLAKFKHHLKTYLFKKTYS